MDFLTLCQRTALNCGVAGTITTTQNQVGSLGRIVQWTGDAWAELQAMRDDWDFMRSSNILGHGISVAPVAGQFNIPLGTGSGQVGVDVDSFGKWDEITFRCYSTANAYAAGGIGIGAIGTMAIGVGGNSGAGGSDETFLDCIDFDVWRDCYELGAMRQVQTRPVSIAIAPDKSLCIGPPTNGLYTITGDYWMAPTLMVADDDEPLGLPLRWQMIICYAAMMKYGYFEAAPDVLQRAQFEYDKMLRQLEASRLPRMGFAGALA